METNRGLKRCDCQRGRALADLSKPALPQAPTISAKAATLATEMMAVFSFFPKEAAARSLIADELRAMCSTEAEALWLVRRMARLYQTWPGLGELRSVFCSSHRPLDGVEPCCISPFFPDGIPSEAPERPPVRYLLASSPSSKTLSGGLTQTEGMSRPLPAPRASNLGGSPEQAFSEEMKQQRQPESALALLMAYGENSGIQEGPLTNSTCEMFLVLFGSDAGALATFLEQHAALQAHVKSWDLLLSMARIHVRRALVAPGLAASK
jgi:hypothetical protein